MTGGNRRPLAIAAGLVAVAVAVLALAGTFTGDESEEAAPVADSRFGRADTGDADPAPPRPAVRSYDVGGQPSSISAGAGYVWAADAQLGTLSRINPRSKQPIRVELAGFPTGVSAGEGAAWVALADRGAIQRVTGTEGAGRPLEVAGLPFRIAAGEGSVWAMSEDSLERVDPVTQTVEEPVRPGGDLADIAAGEGAVWAVRADEEVLRLDPASGEESGGAAVPGAFAVATGESAVWALGADQGGAATLNRIGAGGSLEGDPVPVPGATAVAAGLGQVWVVTSQGLTGHDPENGVPVGSPIDVGRSPVALTVGAGSVWVAASEGAVYRVTP